MKWPYIGITDAFRGVLHQRRLILPKDDCRDLVAAALSSQLLFMAGPSGTGKSAVAKALGTFFTVPERHRHFQVPLGIASESELLGYPTTIGGVLRYQPSAWLDEFQGLAPSTVPTTGAQPLVLGADEVMPGRPSSSSICPPILVFEEANLGTMEGYLSSFMRDFSGLSSPIVTLTLHGSQSAIPRTGGGEPIPDQFVIGLWPRVVATLNVDHTAEPPSRKVAARGLAIVLEPPALTEEDLLHAILGGGQPPPPGPEYFQALAGPMDGVLALEVHDESLLKAIVADVYAAASAIASTLGLQQVISPRNLLRMISFISTHLMVGLGESGGAEAEVLRALGLEFAVLHIVLPSLSEEHFIRVCKMVDSPAGKLFAPMASQGATCSRSPLFRRLGTISTTRGASDFWSALS